MTELTYRLTPDQVFTLLFIMLGPFRFMGPFSLLAGRIPATERKSTAIKSGLTAFLSLAIGAFVGSKILMKWGLQPDVMALAGGLLFFFVALKNILGAKKENTPFHNTTPKDIAFNEIISHYGMATVIVLVASSHDLNHTLMILGCLLLVMLINTIVMATIKPKESLDPGIGARILSTTMGGLQFALSLKLILMSLNDMGVLKTT